jgi:hypothetical protein
MGQRGTAVVGQRIGSNIADDLIIANREAGAIAKHIVAK